MSNCHHARSYKKVASMLTNDASSSSNNSPRDTAKEAKKKKQKSMMGLKMYTGSGTKKSSRDTSNKFKDWSEVGKVCIVKMTNDIKKDVDSGVHCKWEKMYRKITEVMKATNEQEQEGKAAASRWIMVPCIVSCSCIRKQQHLSM
jgi:hypothetical protein